jgi:hypothetical protein
MIHLVIQRFVHRLSVIFVCHSNKIFTFMSPITWRSRPYSSHNSDLNGVNKLGMNDWNQPTARAEASFVLSCSTLFASFCANG